MTSAKRVATITCFIILKLCFAAAASAKEPVAVEITALTETLFYLKGYGGNVIVSSGDDGVFMVDDQYPEQQGPLRDALTSLSLDNPKFLINTHWHRDHAGSNESFSASGALIFAHENVRKRLSEEQFIAFFKHTVPPAGEEALPVVTFTQGMRLFLNDDEVEIYHAPSAHTDGDAVIYFRRSNVLHTGDIFFENMYPFIDTSSGGTIGGVIAAVETMIGLVNEDTQVVPGHGPISDLEGLKSYLKMMARVRKRITERIVAGQSLEQVVAAKPTKEFDEKYASGFLKPDNFVRLIFDNIVFTTLGTVD